MWVVSTIGFYSIVEKDADGQAGTLTIRARVREDLEALRAHYLRQMGPIEESDVADYRYRATAPREAVADALSQLVRAINYSNFKTTVGERQSEKRARLYGAVWETLYGLQSRTFVGTGTPNV